VLTGEGPKGEAPGMARFRRGSPGSPGCAWWLIDAYGLAMILYLILWRTTDDRLLPVYLLGFVAHLALPAAFVWLPLTLLKRRRASLLIQLGDQVELVRITRYERGLFHVQWLGYDRKR
jgi:hypothetical protein